MENEEKISKENEDNNGEINVHFNYIKTLSRQVFKCKPNEKIKFVCLKYASKNDLDFNLLSFGINNFLSETSKLNTPVNELINPMTHDICIYVWDAIDKKELESLKIKIIKVVFLYQNQPIIIESFVHSKMLNISKIFAETIEKDFNKLNFLYKNKNLDFSKKLGEILEQNEKDIDRIEILVQENENNTEINLDIQKNQQNPLTKKLINIDNNI